MTKERALELINHKLNLAENDPLIMNELEHDVLQVCAEVLRQDSALDKIKEEVKQLPITDTAVKLVTEVIDKYINRDLYKEIKEAADKQDLTFAQNYNGRNFALMDLNWIGYFDTIESVAEYLGILNNKISSFKR